MTDSSRAVPRVSVIMTAWNAAPWLREAVTSVFGQTFGDLELVLVDDGSTDATPDIVRELSDPRLRAVRFDRNEGRCRALNHAFAESRGELLALLDADDLARPERIERQVAFLAEHPEVGLLGSRFDPIDGDGNPVALNFDVPCSPALIAWGLLLFTNPFCNSTVMVRRELVESVGGWNEALRASVDRDLWSRLFGRTAMANLDQKLIAFRQHPTSITRTLGREQRSTSLAVRRKLLAGFLGDERNARAIEHWYEPVLDPPVVEGLVRLLLEVYTRLVTEGGFEPAEQQRLREDLEVRLGSIRRRDRRTLPGSLTRTYWSSLLPRWVRRALR